MNFRFDYKSRPILCQILLTWFPYNIFVNCVEIKKVSIDVANRCVIKVGKVGKKINENFAGSKTRLNSSRWTKVDFSFAYFGHFLSLLCRHGSTNLGNALAIIYGRYRALISTMQVFEICILCWNRLCLSWDNYTFYSSLRFEEITFSRGVSKMDRYLTGTISPQQITEGSHYRDVIMSSVASQITGVLVVYLHVCSDVGQRKHWSPASLALVNSPVTGEFPSKRASSTENVYILWRHHGEPCP